MPVFILLLALKAALPWEASLAGEPRKAVLLAGASLEVRDDGRAIGTISLPAGAMVTVEERDAETGKLLVSSGDARAWIPAETVRSAPESPAPILSLERVPPEAPPALAAAGMIGSAALAAVSGENEEAEGTGTETIVQAEGSSSWTCGAFEGNQRSRATFRNKVTGCRRIVVGCRREGDMETICPPPPQPPRSEFSFSTKNVKSQIKNSNPNTFYIDPPDYRKLGLHAGPTTIRMGTERVFQGALFRVRAPGEPAGCGETRMTASWWDGGLRGWHVTEIPKGAAGEVVVSMNYFVTNFQAARTGSLPSLDPAFYTRRGSLPTQDTAVLRANLPCGERLKPYVGRFPIPEGSTHFVIKPGFDGKDKGSLILWNLSVSIGGKPSSEERGGGCGIPAGDESFAGDPDAENEVLRLTNLERAGHGLPALGTDANLVAAARYHARDMDLENYLKHDTYDRKGDRLTFVCDAFTRIAKFDASPAAENIARGQRSPAEVVEAWMKSPGHRRNILSRDVTRLGVGRSGDVWVQNFGY